MTDVAKYLGKRITCVNGWAGLGIMMVAGPLAAYVGAVHLQVPNGLWTANGPIVLWWGAIAAAAVAFAPRAVYDFCRLVSAVQTLFFRREEVPEVSSGTGGD